MTGSRRRTPWDPFPEEAPRSNELRTFALVGLVPEQVLDLVALFRSGDRTSMVARLSEEAGLPWVSAFEAKWGSDEHQARKDGLFDLTWHRRARELDPIITAPNFAGFDVLIDMAEQIAPDAGRLLRLIDPNDHVNPRCREGPDWWQAWHEASGTQAGGWLERAEIQEIWQAWPHVTQPEVEQTCLEAMGASYTHPGCWTLLNDLSGFFAQCISERRGALAEVDA